MDKATLLEKIRASRVETEALLAQLDESHLIKPGVAEGWSVKDLLAHITYWERDTVEVLEAVKRGEVPTVTGEDQTDARNADAVLRSRAHPVAAVLADYSQTNDELIELVEELPEEELTDPDRFPWEHGLPLWQRIAGESYGHEQAHRDQIRAWMKST